MTSMDADNRNATIHEKLAITCQFYSLCIKNALSIEQQSTHISDADLVVKASDQHPKDPLHTQSPHQYSHVVAGRRISSVVIGSLRPFPPGAHA